MTIRLYYRQPDLFSFDAQIVAFHQDNPRQVLLDRTAFYPTSGGQPNDLGMLNAVAVLDVVDAGEVIVHHLAEPLPLGPVHGEIDASRRHDLMQQHSAQHLLSALAADRLGWPTVSVHFGADHSTIEVAATQVSEKSLATLEAMANAVVAEARPITISFEANDEAVVRGLRGAPAREGELRVITIADLDRSACGGTHLAQTAAIGPIRLLGVERVRGAVRIGFLAGERSMTHLRDQDALIGTLAEALGCAPAELVDLVPRRANELREARSRIDALELEVAQQRVARLVQATAPDADGIRRIVVTGEHSPAMRRLMAQCVAGLERLQLVIMGSEPTGVVLATSADSSLDANELLRGLIAIHGGKGGGSARLAQGVVPKDSAILGDYFLP